MPELRSGERTVEVDRHGFLVDPEDWSLEVAKAIAESSSLGPLTDDHWRVVRFVREYYERTGSAPMLRAIGKRTGLSEGSLRELFPRGCRECMCKIAGLSQPTG